MDSGPYRGVMQECYHQACDSSSDNKRLKFASKKFLVKTCQALIDSTISLSQSVCHQLHPVERHHQESGTGNAADVSVDTKPILPAMLGSFIAIFQWLGVSWLTIDTVSTWLNIFIQYYWNITIGMWPVKYRFYNIEGAVLNDVPKSCVNWWIKTGSPFNIFSISTDTFLVQFIQPLFSMLNRRQGETESLLQLFYHMIKCSRSPHKKNKK